LKKWFLVLVFMLVGGWVFAQGPMETPFEVFISNQVSEINSDTSEMVDGMETIIYLLCGLIGLALVFFTIERFRYAASP